MGSVWIKLPPMPMQVQVVVAFQALKFGSDDKMIHSSIDVANDLLIIRKIVSSVGMTTNGSLLPSMVWTIFSFFLVRWCSCAPWQYEELQQLTTRRESPTAPPLHLIMKISYLLPSTIEDFQSTGRWWCLHDTSVFVVGSRVPFWEEFRILFIQYLSERMQL